MSSKTAKQLAQLRHTNPTEYMKYIRLPTGNKPQPASPSPQPASLLALQPSPRPEPLLYQIKEWKIADENNALLQQARHRIVLLNNNEISCGACPLSLICWQGRKLYPWLYQTYVFAVCEVCWCLHFTSSLTSGPLYVCGNLRRGIHRSKPENDPRFYEEQLRSVLASPEGYERKADVVRPAPCGCCEAKLNDIFPDLRDLYRDPSPHERLKGIDCTTATIYKPNIKVEER